MNDNEQLITLEAWRDRNYSSASTPSIRTVRLWNLAGRLVPAAQKQGRRYYIPANARYIDPAQSLPAPTILDRIRGAKG